MESPACRAERYRNKAEEVRMIAESMKDSTAIRMLMMVAQDYLAMAEMVDKAVQLGEATPDLPDH
jgi:hypothetical protein